MKEEENIPFLLIIKLIFSAPKNIINCDSDIEVISL